MVFWLQGRLLILFVCFSLRNRSCFCQSSEADEMKQKGKHSDSFFLLTVSVSVAYPGKALATCGAFVFWLKRSWLLILSFWSCWAWFGTRNCCPLAVCRVALNTAYLEWWMNLICKGWPTFQFLKRFLQVVDVTGLQSSFLSTFWKTPRTPPPTEDEKKTWV